MKKGKTIKKRNTTIKKVVKAADAFGPLSSVESKSKEVDIEPIRQMSIDLKAVYHLAKTRDIESIRTAEMLARRISYNKVIFILMKLREKCHPRPFLNPE